MDNPQYKRDIFAFTEDKPQALWNNIMYILDQNIKVETEIAINSEVQGEKRIHQCGRASALREIREMLVTERKTALDIANIDWKTDETLHQ